MKKVFGIAALLLAFVACNKVETEITPVEQPSDSKGINITATLAPKTAGTKAVADGGDKITVTWAKNEHIAILYDKDGAQVADATITAVDGTTGAATISFTVVSGTADNTACTLVYPYSAAKDDKSGVKDAATLLSAQDGTLNANLDVRVGAGTIRTTTPGLDVTTQPEAKFAIFKFTVKNADASATIDVKSLTITIGTQKYVITPASAKSSLYVALPAVSSQTVSFSATGSDSKTYICSKDGVTFAAAKYYQSTLKMSEPPLLTTITATGKEKASYSTANVATVSFSYTAGGSSAYLANWGWWGYGWIATVTPADGYTITKCVFYDDANRTATDSEAPFVVETTEEDKTPKVNGTPILAYTSKGITKIEVYGYAPFAVTTNSDGNGNYWSTYYNPTASQSFTADASTTIYKAKLNGSSLTLTEVTDIAAGQAVILKSTTGTITLTPAATTSSDFSDNELKGGTTVTDGYDAYTLSRGKDGTGAVGFYKFNGSLDGSKAHLEILKSAGSRSFIGFGDDNTTAIELPALAENEAAEWYSLDGQRLSGKPARKGIYVKNGQKVVIK